MINRVVSRAFSPFAISGVGSLPFNSHDQAFDLIRTHCSEIPFAPQLPAADASQFMLPQLLAPFLPPGAAGTGAGSYEAGPYEFSREQVRLLHQALAEETARAVIPPPDRRCLSGLYQLVEELKSGALPEARLIKIQLCGPLTAAAAFNCDNVNLAADFSMLDLFSELVLRSVRSQIELLRGASDLPITVWLDEPMLQAFIERSDPYLLRAGLDLLKELLQRIRTAGAAPGIHCCSFPPLSFVAGLEPDFISFDAWTGLERLIDGQGERTLIESEIVLALGIVPTGPELDSITAADLCSRLDWHLFDRYKRELLRDRILLTSSCGLALNSPDQAKLAFELLGDLRRLLLD